MTCFLGIDGGGSMLRVALVDDALNVIAETQRATANPNIIGFDAATDLIQAAVREVLVSQPAAVGIGIAGASLAFDWMRALIADVLPGVPVTPALDAEIALVGAHAARRGVLLLAGTGSIAYGINDSGAAIQAGGWGYTLGDEGGGYWLGLQALRALTLWADELDPQAESLARAVLDSLELDVPRGLVGWTYRQPPPVKDIAALAPLVLTAAAAGDPFALEGVTTGARSLVALVASVLRRLHAPQLPVAFAGSLLTAENYLSREVCRLLNLTAIPQPRFSPVIGAVLLAKLSHDG